MVIKSPSMRKILSLSAYVTIAAVVAFLIADRHPPTLAVGAVAPVNERITRFDGSTTTFKRMLQKPLVLNFWATWCPPCLKELPTLSKLSGRYRNRVIFVGATLNSDVADVLELKKRFLLNFELLAVNDALADLWQARALPTTYVINTAGKIVWSKAGISSEEELDAAIQLVLKKS